LCPLSGGEEKVVFIYNKIKKDEIRGKNVKTMTSRKDNEAPTCTPNMCHLGRTWRKKDKRRV
jgi:hypothetical protein